MTNNNVKYFLAFSCCDFFVVLRKVSFNTLLKIYARAIWSGSSKKHLSRLVTKYTITHPDSSRTLQKRSFISIYKLQYTTLMLYYYSPAVLTRLQNSHLKFKSLNNKFSTFHHKQMMQSDTSLSTTMKYYQLCCRCRQLIAPDL